jgi:hypothetical protein
VSFFEDFRDYADLFTALGALLTSVGTAIYALVLTRRRRRESSPEPKPLEDLLQQLTANAVEAGRLATLVQTEIQAQLVQVEKLQKDATEAEHLAALHGAAAEAVAAQFKAAVANESKKSARSAFWSGFLFFVAGVAASIFVTLLVRPIGG